MSNTGQIVWTSEKKEHSGTETYVFYTDNTLGLTDMDSHPIHDAGWQHMKSPNAKTTAALIVTPNTTVATLQRAIHDIHTKGHYTSVEVFIDKPQ